MARYTITIVDECDTVLAKHTDTNEVSLVYSGEYKDGDKIIVETDAENGVYAVFQPDDALGCAHIYITNRAFIYSIPFGEKSISYSPKVFSGKIHHLCIRDAYPFEIDAYKNLALNVADQSAITGVYPHASANIETRGESVFAARNAIDGVRENRSHGAWPYQSWGIGGRNDAELLLEFGRKVLTDRILLYTRSDFPHDSWWKKVTLFFSDSSTLDVALCKSKKPHVIEFEEKAIEWVRLGKLEKADDPSPFPALSQIEVYGKEFK